MRKLMLAFSVAGLSAICLTSCGREKQPTIEKTYTIELTEGQEYSFVLPEDKRKDPYQFVTQASHYGTSVITKNSSNEQVFQYVPASAYHGTDQVVVTNAYDEENGHPSCNNNNGGANFGQCTGNGGGGCFNQSPDDHYKITFNFVIRGATSSNVK